jgi:hypothetical protein
MASITIDQIDERLRELPPEKLAVVYDFVSYLAERVGSSEPAASESRATMVASEAVLLRDWARPEEDEAWANL